MHAGDQNIAPLCSEGAHLRVAELSNSTLNSAQSGLFYTHPRIGTDG